jgi:pSer/pThr/pTyr-binding forkhead associated (FHA) protein
LADKKISGTHCKFIISGNDVYIEDLNSTNGTFIGSHRVTQRHPLENLDEIVVGLSKLSVAIIEQSSDFKAKSPAKAPAPIEVIEDESLEILTPLEDDELIVDESMGDSEATRAKIDTSSATDDEEVELPPQDAVYRETGIRRIEDLIQGEMESFLAPDAESGEGETSTARIGVPKIKVNLSIRRSPEGGSNAVCTKPVTTLGRKDVDIRVNDLDCSRKHTAIEIVAGEKAFVRDLASTNGTYVNGKRVAYQELKNGDLLQIGQTIFEISIEREM